MYTKNFSQNYKISDMYMLANVFFKGLFFSKMG